MNVSGQPIDHVWPTFYIPCANLLTLYQIRHKSLVNKKLLFYTFINLRPYFLLVPIILLCMYFNDYSVKFHILSLIKRQSLKGYAQSMKSAKNNEYCRPNLFLSQGCNAALLIKNWHMRQTCQFCANFSQNVL